MVLLGFRKLCGQTSSRIPVTMTFFLVHICFGKFFGVFSWSNHLAGYHQFSYKICFLSQITIQSRNGLLLLYRIRTTILQKERFFWFSVSPWSTHLLFHLFHLSSLLQMRNSCRMVDVEFLGNLFSCKRISFDDNPQLVFVNFGGCPQRFSSSWFSSPLQTFLKFCIVL